MILLNEINIWKKLHGPYGISEELPTLILKLSETYDTEILEEIIWELIYHQGSVYENTLATIPHLLKILETSNNLEFKLDIIASLGVVLIGLDNRSYLEHIFHEENLNESETNRIQVAFMNSIEKFKTLTDTYAHHVEILDEESKRFYLIAHLVSIKRHKEAEIFKTFSVNDEYIFVCPHCEEETFLWNEENILNAYCQEPVTHKNKKKLPIDLSVNSIDLEWLESPIHNMKIHSLAPLVSYFKGQITCHHCQKKSNIFDGIMNSISFTN